MTVVDCPDLSEYFERLDGPAPETVLELLSPDFRFVAIWCEDQIARPSSGGLEELKDYFRSRDATGQRHHLLHGSVSDDGWETAVGYTTRHDAPLANFTIALRLDGDGRIRRLISARTTELLLLD